MINWLERNMLPCVYKKYLGIECLGCGMQRSFVALLKGELYDSLLLFPALFPALFMLTYLLLHLKYDFKNGAGVLKVSFIFTASLMVINFIVKLINQYHG